MSTGTHLILYDGVCGLCNRLNRFILRRDTAGVFRFASLQSRLGESLLEVYGRDPSRLDTFYVVIGYGSRSSVLLAKSSAALFVLKTLGGRWRLASILGLLPGRVLDWAYHVIARNRYKFFGRYETCLLPSPEHQNRFIDS